MSVELSDMTDELEYLIDILNDADGLTICPVKFAEARKQAKLTLDLANMLRDAHHLKDWVKYLTNFNDLPLA